MLDTTASRNTTPRRRIPAFRALPGLLALLLFPLMTPIQAQTESRSATPNMTELFASFEKDIRRVELENGLRLIMMKRSYAPIVAAYIKFKSGSADETDESSGIAHMLEHMLFKGTRKIGTKDFEREQKYLAVTNLWARRLDHYRRRLEEARKSGDAAELAEAREGVKIWSRRMKMMKDLARRFMEEDEDSYIYSLHGQRGYNAYTSRDLTNYQIQLPANRLEVWARMESDRMQNSVLRDFYTERDVVAEERRMRVENVSRSFLFERFLQEVYGDHPYGRPVIGPMDSIKFLNYEQAYDFYRTYYAPNNTVITLVGDLDFAATEALVRKYFGDMKPQRIKYKRDVAAPEARPVDVVVRKPGSPIQIMGWFKPPLPDPADLHLEILSQILAGRKDSRLFRSLVLEQKLAAYVKVYSSLPGDRYTNLFGVLAVPAPGKDYDAVQQAVLAEIEKVKTEGISQDELDRVRANLTSDFIYRMRSNASLADELSYYETITGDYRTLFKLYADLEKATPADVQASARKYLTAGRMMTGRLVPPQAGGAPTEGPPGNGPPADGPANEANATPGDGQ